MPIAKYNENCQSTMPIAKDNENCTVIIVIHSVTAFPIAYCQSTIHDNYQSTVFNCQSTVRIAKYNSPYPKYIEWVVGIPTVTALPIALSTNHLTSAFPIQSWETKYLYIHLHSYLNMNLYLYFLLCLESWLRPYLLLLSRCLIAGKYYSQLYFNKYLYSSYWYLYFV